VETQKNTAKLLFRIKPKTPQLKVRGDVIGEGRLLVGRAESCDIILDYDSVSAVHAVIEVHENSAKIYDMNSTNGTWVGGKRVIVSDLKPGDTFSLADIDLSFLAYRSEDTLPPVLESLEPAKGTASTKVVRTPDLPEIPKNLPKTAPKVEKSDAPYVMYPLASDPKADSTEYIFEDLATIYPIFKYDTSKQAVEIIILFKDRVYSVDYLPSKDGIYHLAGYNPGASDLEFPYLGKKEKQHFVDVKGGQVSVHKLPGYEIFYLSENQSKSVNQGIGIIDLKPKDILRFSNSDIQIYLRNVEAPPKVATAPIIRRDPVLRKYLWMFFIILTAFSSAIQFANFEEEKKEEVEKAPERLATILYKQKLMVNTNKAAEKTEDKKPEQQKAPPKVAVEKAEPTPTKEEIKKPDIQTTAVQNQKPDPGTKTATEKKVIVKGDPKINKPDPTKAGGSKPSPVKTQTAQPAQTRAAVTAKTNGPVDVYKSADFSSSVNTMLAKGGSLSSASTASATGSSSDFGSGVATGAGTGTSLQRAAVTTGGGSLTGATTGTLGTSKGAEGLSAKRAIYTAGIPSETVVLGSMDPDVIRRILMDNLPKFRYCYQSELERSGADAQGVIRLNFVIGASGHVSQAGVDEASNLPVPVKRCVVNVLKGIQFPEPRGGGSVEVKQPMNFYPKKL
jgi:pSer/pThr/pTyr-binding forkhead associated (FHA) protein/outer membrane biosynthesis protein TonB